MSNKTEDKDTKFLGDIYSNVKMGSDSIINIMSKVKDEEMKAFMTRQLNEYEGYASDIKKRLEAKGAEAKETNPMTKMGAKIGMSMNTMMDSTTSHIAEMMVQGSTMDITDLLQKISVYSKHDECRESVRLAKEIVRFEEENVEKMKAFL